jgi:hypothetical protein
MNSNDINCVGTVRVGTAMPASALDVAGNATIGNAYVRKAPSTSRHQRRSDCDHVTTNYTQLDPDFSDLTDYGIGSVLLVEPHHQPTGMKFYYGNFTVVQTT